MLGRRKGTTEVRKLEFWREGGRGWIEEGRQRSTGTGKLGLWIEGRQRMRRKKMHRREAKLMNRKVENVEVVVRDKIQVRQTKGTNRKVKNVEGMR